jgi:hypothetical protein
MIGFLVSIIVYSNWNFEEGIIQRLGLQILYVIKKR